MIKKIDSMFDARSTKMTSEDELKKLPWQAAVAVALLFIAVGKTGLHYIVVSKLVFQHEKFAPVWVGFLGVVGLVTFLFFLVTFLRRHSKARYGLLFFAVVSLFHGIVSLVEIFPALSFEPIYLLGPSLVTLLSIASILLLMSSASKLYGASERYNQRRQLPASLLRHERL